MTSAITPGDRMAALIDIDGTLVDSTYLHASAWASAIRACGIDIPTSRAHRLIGMRGGRLLEELLGEREAARIAEQAIDEHARRFAAVRDRVAPLPHARDLLERLVARDVAVVLVSSAERSEVEYYLGLLDAQDLVWASTSAADGSRSKPDPEPIEIALTRSGCDSAIVIGDSPWDCMAASAAGLPAVTVLTGGFARSELEGAGAEAVYEHLGDLGDDLDRMGELVARAG
ncbi:MAG TPA: HAD family hydrolase [Gaiellales bacterium]|jgi:HAD superfamily hydrolase (TIGR01549 family)|nr:HAD family hydrolase [Gaiellales bacterium]